MVGMIGGRPWPDVTGFCTDHPTGITAALAHGEVVGLCSPAASEETRIIWRRKAWEAIAKKVRERDQGPSWTPVT